MNKNNNLSAFNNSIETGLRILCILNEAYPKSFDVQFLVYLDYLTIHSGDADSTIKSLHPPVPYRTGEIFVRSSLIRRGLDLYVTKNLVDKIYKPNGIEYQATEESTPFIDSLDEEYVITLCERAKWAVNKFGFLRIEQVKDFIESKSKIINTEFNIEILE